MSLPQMKPSIVQILGEEEPITIGFEAVTAYHGQSALAMLGIIFQGLRASLAELSPDRPVPRAGITVVSGHPGPGVRDAFEFVTRAVTRQAYTVDRTLPDSRFNPHADMSYSFRISSGDRTVAAALKPGILPDRFFYLIKPDSGARSAAETAEFSQLKRDIAAKVLALPPAAVFTLG